MAAGEQEIELSARSDEEGRSVLLWIINLPAGHGPSLALALHKPVIDAIKAFYGENYLRSEGDLPPPARSEMS